MWAPPLSREGLGEVNFLTLLLVYMAVCQRNRRTNRSSMSFAECLAFWQKLPSCCHFTCTALLPPYSTTFKNLCLVSQTLFQACSKHFQPIELFNPHAIVMPILQVGQLRPGEVTKLTQGHTTCQFCGGSLMTGLQLGRNFVEMGPSTLEALSCRPCASSSAEMRYSPHTSFQVAVPVLDAG